ncbi:MAG: cytochrome C [Bacteroidetes bacterium]|nr:cytochrome C [Bacteroidota bacterium]
MRRIFFINIFLLMLFSTVPVIAQISPGQLASVHSHLEGISNCTHCHTLGDKVTNDKCLSCHTEIKARLDLHKGYHASSEVKGKNCTSCHSDHHGLTFQIIRFDKEKFNHTLTGFTLSGAHSKKVCKDCHKAEFIANGKLKSKKFTYLGLNTNCLPCHTDYHQKTITAPCLNCHGDAAFKPAPKFNHASAKFPLQGMHQTVPCVKCHPVTMTNTIKFQQFSGILYKQCSNCHTDPHHGQFGPNCMSCHSEASFHTVKGISNFDHFKTKYPLENKHQGVPCKSCHKTNVTDPVKHSRCFDCHSDYHYGQFAKQGVIPDCSGCHSTKGFTGTSFTIEQHNSANFKLDGAHLATPCFACHKKQEKWSFRQIGIRCADCHKDIHEGFINKKYYPDNNCSICHNPSHWGEVSFDHSLTQFAITGPHATLSCRACHFKKDSTGVDQQQFADMSANCSNCHKDNHNRQFETNGITDCLRCHNASLWKITTFDHNKTTFKLDGKHQNVACAKCHKTVTEQNITYVLYKIKDTRCESCH